MQNSLFLVNLINILPLSSLYFIALSIMLIKRVFICFSSAYIIIFSFDSIFISIFFGSDKILKVSTTSFMIIFKLIKVYSNVIILLSNLEINNRFSINLASLSISSILLYKISLYASLSLFFFNIISISPRIIDRGVFNS